MIIQVLQCHVGDGNVYNNINTLLMCQKLAKINTLAVVAAMKTIFSFYNSLESCFRDVIKAGTLVR